MADSADREASDPAHRLRVCLVSHEFAPFYGGGAGTYASIMSAALAAAGHEVHLLTPRDDALRHAPALRPGVTFHGIDWDRPPASLHGFPSYDLRHSYGVLDTLLRLDAERPFDYIEFPDFHAEGYCAIEAGRSLGRFPRAVLGIRLHIPLAELRAINDDPWIDRDAAFSLPLENRALAGADVIFSPSRAMLDLAGSRLPFLRAGAPPAHVLPNPFDFALLDELGPRAEPDPTDPLFLFVGRLTRAKGAETFIRAAVGLLQRGIRARFHLVGADTDTGPGRTSMLAHLRALIEPDLADRFTFDAAHLPRHQLAPLVTSAAACVFPSQWENFPYACLEAMALGSPVVAAAAGGLAEIIRDGESGLLFPPGDASALEAGLATLLADPTLAASLRELAPQRIRELCDPPTIVRRTLELVDAARRPLVVVPEQPEPVTAILTSTQPDSELAAALHALARQTRAPRRIVVVGPMHGLAVLNPFSNGAHVEFHRAEHAGACDALNIGLRMAQTPLVLPLARGERPEPEFIATLTAALARRPAAFATCPAYCCHAERPELGTIFAPIGLDRDILPVLNCAGAAAIFRRDSLLAVGGFCPEMEPYQDWDVFSALAERGEEGLVIPLMLLAVSFAPDHPRRTLTRRRHEILRAELNRRHPSLAADPGRALRFMLSECSPLPAPHDQRPPGDPYDLAERIIEERLRYRLADRLNSAIKKTPLHRILRDWAQRNVRPDNGPR